MRKILISALILSTALSSNIIYSDNNRFHHDDDRTYIGTSFKGRYTRSFSDINALSLLGEAGPRNFRVGGTFGWKIQDNSFLKLSGELLRQNIEYAFLTTNSHEWVNQGAIGAGYEFDCAVGPLDPGFDITTYYSHAQSKNLNPVFGVLNGNAFTNFRRIAGGNAAGVAPGIFVHPWYGARAGVDLNYDHVEYERKFENNESANGLGGTARFHQQFNNNIAFNAAAAFRKPFNNYEANLMWGNIPYYGNWALGVEADYTVGKHELPNTYNVALTADYALDCATRHPVIDHKGEVSSPPVNDPHLIAWTATPAVYMPQVLAIADERLTLNPTTLSLSCNGVAPTVIGTIIPPSDTLGDGINPQVFTIPTAQIFSGQNLTFSLRFLNNPGLSSISIDPSTGVITINYVPSILEPLIVFFVTASNQCGSVTAPSFTRTLQGTGGDR